MDLQGKELSRQIRRLAAEVRAAWNAIVTCTEPVDRPCAEAMIKQIYTSLDLPPPRFVWCDSPMAAQMAIATSRRRQTSAWELIRRLTRSGWRTAFRQAPKSGGVLR